MPTDEEIEAAAKAMMDLEGGYIAPWRVVAKAGLEAAEKARKRKARRQSAHCGS